MVDGDEYAVGLECCKEIFKICGLWCERIGNFGEKNRKIKED